MLPYDTVLSRFMRTFGDTAGSRVYQLFYESTIVGIVIWASTILAGIYLALNIQKDGKNNRYPMVFVFTLLFSLPTGSGKPIGYRIIDSASNMIASSFAKIATEVFASNANNDLAMASMLNSVSTRYPADIRGSIVTLIENCVPEGVTYSTGKPIAPYDLFRFVGDVDNMKLDFDQSLLLQRMITVKDKQVSCADLHDKTVKLALLYNKQTNEDVINQTNLSKDYQVIRSGSSELADKITPKVALASGFLNTSFEVLKGNGSVGVNDDTYDAMANSGSYYASGVGRGMQLFYYLSNLKAGVMRATGMDSVGDIHNLAREYREKMQDLPYVMSVIFLVLQLAFSLIVFTPLITGGFRYLMMWTGVFITVKASAWILVIMRLIFNQISLHHWEDFSQTSGQFFLQAENMGVMSSEVFKMTENYLLVEKSILGALMIGVPGAAMFMSRGPKASSFGKVKDSTKGFTKDVVKSEFSKGFQGSVNALDRNPIKSVGASIGSRSVNTMSNVASFASGLKTVVKGGPLGVTVATAKGLSYLGEKVFKSKGKS